MMLIYTNFTLNLFTNLIHSIALFHILLLIFHNFIHFNMDLVSLSFFFFSLNIKKPSRSHQSFFIWDYVMGRFAHSCRQPLHKSKKYVQGREKSLFILPWFSLLYGFHKFSIKLDCLFKLPYWFKVFLQWKSPRRSLTLIQIFGIFNNVWNNLKEREIWLLLFVLIEALSEEENYYEHYGIMDPLQELDLT